MDASGWRQLRGLLEEALELTPGARADFVAAVAQSDPHLGDELGALVSASDQAGFLDRWRVRRPTVTPPALGSGAPGPAGRVDAVSLHDVDPYTHLVIETRRRRYALLLVSPLTLEVVVQGGRRWLEPTPAVVGSATIEVGGRLLLEVSGKRISTSRITTIEIRPRSE